MLMKICVYCGKEYPAGTTCPCRKKREKKRQSDYDQTRRDKDAAAFYRSRAWTRLRGSIKTRSNGLDEFEWYKGHAVAGTMAHHIVPLEDDPKLGLDVHNLIWVSAKTHKIIHDAYAKSTEAKAAMQRELRRAIRSR